MGEGLEGYSVNKIDQCKIDMCYLCCAKFDYTKKIRVSKKNLNLCYESCNKSKNILNINNV